MFLQWGNGQDDVRAGEMGWDYCPRCEDETPTSLLVRYHFGYVYFVFSCITRFEYFLKCDICGYASAIDAAVAKPHVERLDIPFMRRYGCLMGLGLMVLGFTCLILITRK